MTPLTTVRAALTRLQCRPFTDIGRAATLTWLAFGDVPRANQRAHQGGSAPALHLQCRWRLARGAAVLVQEGDLFVPAAHVGADFEAGGEIGTSRFDERVRTVARLIAQETPLVESIRLGDKSDLQLMLTGGLSLEVFPAHRQAREDWRLLSGDEAGRHHVAEGGTLFTV